MRDARTPLIQFEKRISARQPGLIAETSFSKNSIDLHTPKFPYTLLIRRRRRIMTLN